MKRAALMFALTLFTSMVTTARADAQILGQLLAPNIAIPVVNADQERCSTGPSR